MERSDWAAVKAARIKIEATMDKHDGQTDAKQTSLFSSLIMRLALAFHGEH